MDLREAATRLYISLQYRQQVRLAAKRKELTSGPAQLTSDTTTAENQTQPDRDTADHANRATRPSGRTRPVSK